MDEKDIFKLAIPLVAVPLAGVWLFKHHFADHNNAKRLLSFKNLDECMSELDKIQHASALKIDNDWTLYQNLVHCTQSITYSMTGYPEIKSRLFRETVGKLVFNQFEHQGYIRHNRSEPLPGASLIQPNGNIQDAVSDLKKTVTDFEDFTQELKPHFAFGKLSKSQFADFHCMHLADHFAIMTY